MTPRKLSLLSAGAAFAVAPLAAHADEGMWTFDGFPRAKVEAAYGWAPDQAWLDTVRGAAVRLTGGCSASFVSGEGLILTNHHCVATCLSDNSGHGSDLLVDGYNAATLRDEKKCPGQQAELVTAITDVTPRIKSAMGTLTGEAMTRARDGAIAKIEAEGCTDRAKTRCQVVTLFGGGQYKLYTYRKYADVRLVWAPEDRAATFGGDPDNFNFPRYSLDGSFLRAYEDGKPVSTPKHLRWNPRAPKEGEMTFVVGNPGSTARLYTGSQLALEREIRLPMIVTTLSELRGRLIRAMEENPQRESEGRDELNLIENSLKVYIGRQKALNDPAFVARLAGNEADLKAKAASTAPWERMDSAVAAYRPLFLPSYFMSPTGMLYGYARTLVLGAAERGKPNAERLPGYTDSALPLTIKELLDAAPVHPWLDGLQMSWKLSKAREYLGVDDPDTHLLLGEESPEALARRLVAGTKLADPAYRKQLWEGGAAAIAASQDPMIVYARHLEARQRALRKQVLEQYDGPATAAAAGLTAARFAAYGDTLYPDATFTLRISYGKVQGWTELGQQVPYATTMGGTFTRATPYAPFDLPRAFVTRKQAVPARATYDYVTTNDIIGGNSGSPVVDREGTVIGAAFDGNIHSLGGNYGYDPLLNRTVVVSTLALQTALEKLYPSPRLVKELAAR